MHPNVPGLDVFDLDDMGKKLLRYVIGHKMTQNLSESGLQKAKGRLLTDHPVIASEFDRALVGGSE
jgi:hypothetical protein